MTKLGKNIYEKIGHPQIAAIVILWTLLMFFGAMWQSQQAVEEYRNLQNKMEEYGCTAVQERPENYSLQDTDRKDIKESAEKQFVGKRSYRYGNYHHTS